MNATAERAPGDHTPPLGHRALTPLYDAAIAILTRERRWRRALVDEIRSGAHEAIIDIGSGTGSLAALLYEAAPATRYVGVDPDADAIAIAREKLSRRAGAARFVKGYFPEALTDEPADVIVSSLVLHQVPLDEKRRIFSAAFARLPPGGRFIIADYGEQRSSVSRFLFRMTVQALDGRENTQPNADGALPRLAGEAGFHPVTEKLRLPTATGAIAILECVRPVRL